MSLNATQKAAIVAEYAQQEGDTGSPEVQVALLTTQINHFKAILKSISMIIIHVVVYYVWLHSVVNYLIT